jgi:hypothetical protein
MVAEVSDINPEKALTSIAKIAPEYAQAKANRIYCDEYRKTLKAQLMKDALAKGFESAIAQEREAYADPTYAAHLEAIRETVQIEETLRWKLVAAEAAVEVWRSRESTNRMMDRGTR